MSDGHTDVGSYVAHALDHDERRAFERHHHDCENCRVEQQEFDETLAELTILSATPPPAGLRADLLAAVRQIRPLPPVLAPVVDLAPRLPERPAQPIEPPRMYLAGTDDEAPTAPAPDRRRRLVAVLSGLVAAALVVALSLGMWVRSLDQQHRDDVAAATAQSRLVSAPDTTIYRSTLNGAAVSYVVSHKLDEAMLVGTGLPDPGPGRTYQLWRITKSGAQPAGLVARQGTGHTWFVGSLAQASQLAVTVEPLGGSATPTLPVRSAVDL